uniref:class I SAM-dependent DNA methyltransferase n=1 Tax=Candidatus Chloroploca sp. Khr17 TaxID=2496869 RepID=UPI0013EB37B7
AQVTVWIGYIQWHKDNGFAELKEPILQPLDTIKRMDAILAFDETGKPVEPAWPEADVIIGNPPFLGDKKMRAELGDKYVEDLRKLFEGRVPGGADLVTYWFERAREFIERGKVKRVGLLATQSVRAGANRKVLERIKQSGNIFMAWRDRPWVLEGAQVRVSMVGFDAGIETDYILDDKPVVVINSDLTTSLDLTTASRLRENMSLAFIGTQKTGSFELDSDQATAMLSTTNNSYGRSNEDVVRRWVNGSDITNRPKGMWIIFFGENMSFDEAKLYEEPFRYVEQHVKPERLKSRQKRLRECYWLFEKPRPAMWRAAERLHRFIITPRVARHRIFVFLETTTIPDTRTVVIMRSDEYFLGILHSYVHELWALSTSSRHGVGNDPTYNAQSCFETFPFPWPPGQEPLDDPRVTAISEAAQRLVAQRDTWLNEPGLSEAELKQRTLTKLYNQRPPWLDQAHKELDQAVCDAYGWPHDLSDEAILTQLLALNLARAAKQGDAAAAAVETHTDDEE